MGSAAAPKYDAKEHSIFAFTCLGLECNWVVSRLVQSKSPPVTVNDRECDRLLHTFQFGPWYVACCAIMEHQQHNDAIPKLTCIGSLCRDDLCRRISLALDELFRITCFGSLVWHTLHDNKFCGRITTLDHMFWITNLDFWYDGEPRQARVF